MLANDYNTMTEFEGYKSEKKKFSHPEVDRFLNEIGSFTKTALSKHDIPSDLKEIQYIDSYRFLDMDNRMFFKFIKCKLIKSMIKNKHLI